MSHTIAITNQKGGVGKTTTTLNLGVGLARQGQRVLIVDADPQGSLTLSMGIRDPDELDVSLATVLQATADGVPLPADTGIIHHAEGVDLLPANIDLSAFEVGLFNTMSREHVLRSYVQDLRHNYDTILIDCMPSLGMLAINALVAADSVIVPCQPSYLSTKGLTLLMQSISKVRRINRNLKLDGILLTMVDNRTNNSKAIIQSLRQSGSSLWVFDAEIPFSVRTAESSLAGKSIFAYDGKGKVAAAYEALTKEVIELERHTKDRSGPEESVR